MKKTILKYGLFAGAVVTAMMVVSSIMMNNDPDFKGSMIIGFGGMLIGFAFIFLGIKKFRDKENGGVVSFGKALQIGLLIALIASCCYVGVWMIEYHFFFPDFMEKYSAMQIKSLQSSGLSADQLAKAIEEVKAGAESYKNPVYRIMVTFMEILPIGILVALISALILKKSAK